LVEEEVRVFVWSARIREGFKNTEKRTSGDKGEGGIKKYECDEKWGN
jgi:hypothetical protein